MSELGSYYPYANRDGFYHKSDVDKVIAEKDKEVTELKTDNERLKKQSSCTFSDDCLRVRQLKAEAERLKRELDKSNEIYAIRRKKLRATRKALWLARAERAKERKIHFDTLDYFGISFVTINFESARTWMNCRIEEPSKWAVIFEKVEQKCKAKAEEYK